MSRQSHLLVLFAFTLSVAFPAAAQTQPCIEGNLADVLGSSCSIGRLTFNFQSKFFGGASVFDQGKQISQSGISATDIGFIPVSNPDQVGFRLVTNFTDGPGTDTSFSSIHFVQFTYDPQPNPGSDIVEETVLLDATGQGDQTNLAFSDALDFQNFSGVGFVGIDAGFNTQLNPVVPVQIMGHQNFLVPALSSVPSTFSGTQLSNIATGNAQAVMKSATFLYRVGPADPPPAANLIYTNFDLPGVSTTFISGIANTGQIAGSYQDQQGIFHAFITHDQNNFTTVDFPGAIATFGSGINDRNELVGGYTDVSGQTHGLLLRDQDFISIDFPNAIFTEAISINDEEQIVGIYQTADQSTHGFLLQNGQFTSIDQVPQNVVVSDTEALGINNRGEIVGTFFDPDTLRGLIQRKASFLPSDVPGQTNTVLEGINDRSDIVGAFNDINQTTHGFISRGETFRTVDFPSTNTNFALGINGAGTIVGEYIDAAGKVHSFVARPINDVLGENDEAASAGAKDATGARTTETSRTLPSRICGSAEWRQHPEQIRDKTSCQLPH